MAWKVEDVPQPDLAVRVLRRDGPATSADLAKALGIPMRQASAVLHKLWRARRVFRSPRPVPRPAGPGAFLYGIRKWQVSPPKEAVRRVRKRVLRPWTTKDLARLAAMEGRPDAEAAFALGRTVAAVQHRRRRMPR